MAVFSVMENSSHFEINRDTANAYNFVKYNFKYISQKTKLLYGMECEI